MKNELAAAWIASALADLKSIEHLIDDEFLTHVVAFHAQQCVETTGIKSDSPVPHDLGIVAEPYFDVDYSQVFYITDTGRKWNNEGSSIRDKVQSGFNIPIKSTGHLIRLAQENKLPDKIMINTHPQRWEDRAL